MRVVSDKSGAFLFLPCSHNHAVAHVDQQVLNPTPPLQHATSENRSCAAIFSESCAAEVALQHSLFCSVNIVFAENSTATNERPHCGIEKPRCSKVALSCRFPADFMLPRLGSHVYRVRKLNTNFLSQAFRAPPRHPAKNPGVSRQKVWFPWVSKDIPNFLASTPSRERRPNPPEDIQTKELGFGFLFLA